VEDRLRLTLGAKLEHNDFTGFEGQPGIRLLWTPNRRHSLWASASRAVRTPNRVEDGGHFAFKTLATPLPVRLDVLGNFRYRAEDLWAFETGWRYEFSDRTAFDLAMFYNLYNHLRTSGQNRFF